MRKGETKLAEQNAQEVDTLNIQAAANERKNDYYHVDGYHAGNSLVHVHRFSGLVHN